MCIIYVLYRREIWDGKKGIGLGSIVHYWESIVLEGKNGAI